MNVLQPCLKVCKSLQANGVILEYKRVDAFDYDHKRGAPDIEIRYVLDNTLHLLMCECKRKDGKGRQLQSQIEYQAKYKLCANVDYILVESDKQLYNKIIDLTGLYEQQKKEILEINY
jgi:hypothetical protein